MLPWNFFVRKICKNEIDNQISWMTKQGYSAEQIDDVIASEVMQEEAKETAKEGEQEAEKEKQGDYASMKSG